MATFSVTHHQRLDDVAVVQTLETTDITVGQTITLTGLGHGLNGTYIVIAVPVNLFAGVNEAGDLLFNENEIIVNQLMFQDVGDDLELGPLLPPFKSFSVSRPQLLTTLLS